MLIQTGEDIRKTCLDQMSSSSSRFPVTRDLIPTFASAIAKTLTDDCLILSPAKNNTKRNTYVNKEGRQRQLKQDITMPN